MPKIAFFDIDGTITSETDGSIPQSTIDSIRQARENGHLMFINTGRCFQNVEQRFRDIGFDGYVCGCGTDIYCGGQNLLYVPQSHETTMKILQAARSCNVDLLFESKRNVAFDLSRPLKHPEAIKQYEKFVARGYDMPTDFEHPEFSCDKFVIWFKQNKQLEQFRKISDIYFECIDRGGNFREFVPYNYSKATGIQFVLDYYRLSLDEAYAFGDSNNDLTMLNYVPNSIAMGNSKPESLKELVSHVTESSSNDGIMWALKKYNFL